ncbi:MAG TPA: PAS domain S-box protein, partial [Rhodothermales bacterium]|nr:PAS domain S-box protein [Rhodothermales bacterium]
MEPIPSPQSPHDRPLAQSRSSAPTGDAITQSAALALSAPMALLAVVRDGHMDVAASAGPVPAAGPWLDALYAAVALHHGPLAVDSIDAAPRTDGAPATSCVAVALRDEAGAACGLLAVLYEGPGRPGRPGGLQTLDALAHVAADALGLIPERATGEAALSEGDGLLQSLDGFLPGLSVPRETERETALYRAFYEAVLEQSPTQIIVVDREGRYVHLNPAYEPDPEIRAWLIGKTVLDYGRRTGLDESIGREIRAAEDDVVQTGRACTLELELPGPDGPRYVDRLAGPVYDHTGRVSHVVWHSVDVTERRRAERALRESEERFRHLAEATPSGLVVTDEAGRITFVNRETEQLFGYAREELDGQSVEILLPEADRREHVAQRAAFADNPNPRHLGTGREVFGRRKDGSLVPIEVGLAPFETAGRTAVLATVVDLTARRAAEAALRRSEERLAAVVEGLDEGLIIADHDGNVLQWNRTALAQHGFATLEEGRRALPEFRDLFEVRPPGGEVLPFEQWPLPRIFAGETLNGVVLQLRRVGAEWGPTFRYGGATVSDAEGRLIAFITVVDVTEQEAAAAALQARAAELQAITDHTEDAILRYDRDLRYLFANPAIEQVTGVAPAALIGKTYVEAGLPPEVAEQRARELREVFDTGRPVSYEVAFPGPHGPRAYTVRAVPEQRGPDGRVETI